MTNPINLAHSYVQTLEATTANSCRHSNVNTTQQTECSDNIKKQERIITDVAGM